MKPEFLLTVKGYQHYENQEPDMVELTTDAELTADGGVLYLSYRETELTGLVGTVTTFEIHPHSVILRRSGTLNSELHFMVGKTYESLYDMGHGALLVSVRTTEIDDRMTLNGGTLRVSYRISIEGLGSGRIVYAAEVRRKPEGGQQVL